MLPEGGGQRQTARIEAAPALACLLGLHDKLDPKASVLCDGELRHLIKYGNGGPTSSNYMQRWYGLPAFGILGGIMTCLAPHTLSAFSMTQDLLREVRPPRSEEVLLHLLCARPSRRAGTPRRAAWPPRAAHR